VTSQKNFKNAGAVFQAAPAGADKVQDFSAGTAAGMGEFCADAAAGFFAPSSQLNLFVLSKMRWIIAAKPNRKIPWTTMARKGSYKRQILHMMISPK
jgi:hypothetical protein